MFLFWIIFRCSKRSLEPFYNSSKWNLYAIGDIYYYDKWTKKPNYGKRMERDIRRQKYNGTLAYAYYHQCKKRQDKETLHQLIEKHPYNIRPGKKDLVMHIRIGDIKEGMRELWKKSKSKHFIPLTKVLDNSHE